MKGDRDWGGMGVSCKGARVDPRTAETRKRWSAWQPAREIPRRGRGSGPWGLGRPPPVSIEAGGKNRQE